MRMHVYLPIICYDDVCDTNFMFSLMKLVLTLKDMSISTSVYPICFDSLVDRAKNSAIAFFMSGLYTHLLFLDTNIPFNVDDIIKLLHTNEKLIGGTINKVDEVLPMDLCANYSVSMERYPDTNKMEVEYLTKGCMLIDKTVIDILIRSYPERKYTNTIAGYMGANQNLFYNFFCGGGGENVSFCRLWREQGGKVYLLEK